jgi:tetratricopeptide (TPR) repeat protein
MSDVNHSVALSASADAILAEVVAEITDRLHAGSPVDVEEHIARYPELAERLRRLLPALQIVDGVGGSAGEVSSPGGIEPKEADGISGMLGDFRIIREVGRGGMGIVYEAEQISLGRRVALKVLPFAATMDPRHLQRFHNEARAAASLQHPNIVPVHAVGCERAVHYYAMQFIDGRTLASLIARRPQAGEQRTVAYTPPANADTAPAAAAATSAAPRDATFFRRVAAWGAQAAEALEYAHSLGVVHRDVKPANLMIDGQGKLWVTDFGLARFGADSSLTLTGDLLGTLRYMSPEQALAKHGLVDHRTDVYSLGATLYELLTGRPAVGGKDREEILRKIAFEEPAPPRALERGVPADLETVVLKALAKVPAERYATAKELADDLRHWLEDRPVRARRPTLAQRGAKWCKRHLAAVVAASVVSCLAAAGLAVGVALIWEADAQKAALLIEKNQALDDKDEAMRQAQQAQQKEAEQRAAAEAARDRAKSYFRDSLRILDATQDSYGFAGMGREELQAALGVLRNAVSIEEKAAADSPDEAELWRILMMTNEKVSVCFQQLGGLRDAVGPQRRAVAVCRHWAAAFPNDRKAHLAGPSILVHHLRSLGGLLRATGQLQEAEETYGETISLRNREEQAGPLSEIEWMNRVDDYNSLGFTRLEAGRLPEARQAFGQAVSLVRAKLPDGAALTDGAQLVLVYERGRSRIGLGNVLLAEGQQEEPARTFRLALQDLDLLTKPLGGHGLTDSDLDCAWFLVTCPVKELQDPARALKLAEKVIEESVPHDMNRQRLALAWKVKGLAHYRAGDWKASIQAMNRSREHRTADSTVRFVEAMAQWQLGEKKRAGRPYDTAVRWMEENRPTDLDLRRFRAEAAELLGVNAPPLPNKGGAVPSK